MVEFNPSNEFKIKANSFLEKHDTSRILKKIKIDPTKIGNALRTYGDKRGTSLLGEIHLSEVDKRALFTDGDKRGTSLLGGIHLSEVDKRALFTDD